MKEGYVIRDQSLPHFLTATIVDWIDVFSRKNYRDCVIECFKFCIKNKGMILYSYVIISNHIHMIVQSNEGKLSDLIRDFKKFTSKTILEKIQSEPESRREWMLERFKLATENHSRNRNFQFWQLGNHAEEIYSEKFMWSKVDYIHFNPVRAGKIMNVKSIAVNSIFFFFILFVLISCKKSKEDQDRELIEYYSGKEGDWSAAMSRPVNHPTEAPMIEYFCKGKAIINTGTTSDIANSGWADSSQGRNSGYGTAYPDSVYVSYGGLNDKLEMCTYEGGAKLPAQTIEKLFKEGFIDRGKKKYKFKEIITGMAPGGRICVWVDHIEITRFIIKQKDTYYDKPVIIFGDKYQILSYLNHHPIDYSVWEKPDSKYDLDYGFCSENIKNIFFYCVAYTREGIGYTIDGRYIDYTYWKEPFGEKPNLNKYSGYQQIGTTKKDYKLNLPTEINLIWKKDSAIFYSTNILMPKDLPERFTKSYTNPLTVKKANYNRIVFGVEKDGEHCIVWLDGPGKQEKIIRFKGKRQRKDNDESVNSGGYATEIVYY